ncbi:MAG: DUF748 domain-containing protein [Methylotenera sp.]
MIGYFAIDPLAKKLIPRIADKSLDSMAHVKRVEFDPFRLKATVHELDLTNKTGGRLAGFKKLVVDFELSGMFDLAWKFKQIGIAEPYVNLAIAQGGKLNWDALIAKLNEGPEQPPSDTIPSVIIEHFIVSQGNMHYHDANRPTPIDMTLAPLSFQLKGFSTVPRDRGEYLISAAFSEEGGILKWKGDMGVNPVASTGIVSLDGVKIAEALELVKGLALPINITNGEVQTSFSYDFAMPNNIPTLALSNMTINVAELAGETADGGAVRLTHAGFIVPRLDFVQNQQPELHLKDLDFKLLDFNISQENGSNLLLKNVTATLPTLDFGMQSDQPQLTFNDLNIKLTSIDLHQDRQFSVMIPNTEVNAMNLDLAKNSINIKDIVVSSVEVSPQAKESQNDIEPIATLDKIAITDGQIGLADKTIKVGSILLSGLKTSVINNADNSLNWVALLDSKDATASPSVVITQQKKASTQPLDVTAKNTEDSSESEDNKASVAWSFNVPSVALNQANIHIKDNSAPSAIVMDVQDASIELNNVSSDMTKPLPLKAAFTVKQGGQLSVNGNLRPTPLKADLRLQLSKLSLKPFAPYVSQFALLRLNTGSVDVSGQLKLEQEQAFKLDFNGKFGVEKLAVVEEADDKPFLSWNRLGSDNLTLSLMPNKLHMGQLKIQQPSAKFIIYEDKTTNLDRILRNTVSSNQNTLNKEDEVSKTAEPKPVNQDSLIGVQLTEPKAEKTVGVKATRRTSNKQSATNAFPVDIDVINVNNAQLEFADLSLTPQFGTNIHSLNGVVNSLSTQADKVAQVEMAGKVDAYGSAKINGALQPLNATEFMDINLAFANLDMSKLTPYSGKFAGRYIDSGRLSVDLHYKIKQQQLVAENKFVINKIKLGEKVESNDAADLPLDLAIAILEDSNGVIDLDLPIKGSLDNPEFSFASIAWKAFRNVITKIVTAPFRVLGKLFGGDGEDFDGIHFEAGGSEISPPELEKLMNVGLALTKRQGLSLGIVPSYSLTADTEAIQTERYRMQVMKEMGVELEAGQKPGPIDLTNEEVRDAVDALYNDLTNKGLFKRLASKFEEPEQGHYEKAQAQLIESIEVSKADLNMLAQARAEAVKAALVTKGVSQERLTLANTAEVKAEANKVITALTLDVKPSSGTQPETTAQ